MKSSQFKSWLLVTAVSCLLFLTHTTYGSVVPKAPASPSSSNVKTTTARAPTTKHQQLVDSDRHSLKKKKTKPKKKKTAGGGDGENTEILVFTGDCTLASEPCDVPNKHDLVDFFKRQETMKLFLSAGGRRPCSNVPITPDIQNLWKQACQKHDYYGGTTVPCEIDLAMETDTDAQFPGFKMITTVLNGCRRFEDPKTGMPVYEFCMIGDKKCIVGSPPVVWLVRKLTGQSKEDESDTFQLSETKARSTISITPVAGVLSGDDRGDNIATTAAPNYAFQLDVQFKTTVKFPKMLLKMLPASKSKVEERGTQSVRKVILKDAEEGVQAVRDSWISISTQSSSQR